MASVFAGKVFFAGKAPIVKTAVYTVPAGKTAYVKTISVRNINAATQTADLFINIAAVSYNLMHWVLLQNEGDILSQSICLPAGSIIELVTTTAAALDCVITGVEETIA